MNGEIRIYLYRKSEKHPGKELFEKALESYCRQSKLSDGAWETAAESRGKPYFIHHPEVSFSISDSGEWYACAFADQRTGIDIQLHNRHRSESARSLENDTLRLARISRRFFHEKERDYVCGSFSKNPEELLRQPSELNKNALSELRARFYMLWTAKEAYVKYTGQGIDGSFSKICTVPASGSIPAFPLWKAESGKEKEPVWSEWEAEGVQFAGINIGKACSLCICTPEKTTRRTIITAEKDTQVV